MTSKAARIAELEKQVAVQAEQMKTWQAEQLKVWDDRVNALVNKKVGMIYRDMEKQLDEIKLCLAGFAV